MGLDPRYMYGTPSQRYPALRVIAGLYLFAAVLAALGTVAAFLALLDRTNMQAGGPQLEMMVGIVVAGGIVVLSLVAAAEGIRVVMDIEQNTRRIAERSERPPQPSEPEDRASRGGWLRGQADEAVRLAEERRVSEGRSRERQ